MAVVLASSGNGPALTRSAGPIGVGLLKTRVGLLILLPMSKNAAKAARREAAASAASGFPTPVPLTKVQALELLKGDLDGELFLELQTRLAKPKVVPPKKEDALLRKRIEKDIWDGVIGLWSRVAPILSPMCGKKDVPTGLNLNQYAGTGSLIRWHSDNEPLFGPQNSPKLIVSLSLGNSVEFKVRRRSPGKVPSWIRLDHGDILVMDGLAQSEYEHCTASGLQGPRVNLTFG